MNSIQDKEDEDFNRRKATIHCVDKKDKLSNHQIGIFWKTIGNLCPFMHGAYAIEALQTSN